MYTFTIWEKLLALRRGLKSLNGEEREDEARKETMETNEGSLRLSVFVGAD